MDLYIARFRDSFYDKGHGGGTDLLGKNEKQFRILHFRKNFHHAFITAVLRMPDDETVFKNLVLTRRWITQRQQAVVGIDCHFDNHITHDLFRSVITYKRFSDKTKKNLFRARSKWWRFSPFICSRLVRSTAIPIVDVDSI